MMFAGHPVGPRTPPWIFSEHLSAPGQLKSKTIWGKGDGAGRLGSPRGPGTHQPRPLRPEMPVKGPYADSTKGVVGMQGRALERAKAAPGAAFARAPTPLSGAVSAARVYERQHPHGERTPRRPRAPRPPGCERPPPDCVYFPPHPRTVSAPARTVSAPSGLCILYPN